MVITTLVDSASARIEDRSAASAWISGISASAGSISASRSRVASSLDGLRPASAQLSPGALRARYSAVSPPVKPVAP